ncbi:MAG: hypothetical protein OSB41_09590, partial [Kiritimatiellae bacterium]|nr:hypothetical protein [Kiritimatiellia bacterium]
MNIKRQLPVVFALIATLCNPAHALDTFTWPFNSSTNYGFDAELIHVRDGEGKLILLADELIDGDVADHTTAVQRVNITLGTEQSVRQTKDHTGSYESPGTFISRIFEAGGGNEWKRITMASSSAKYISDPSIVMLTQFDGNWLDQVSGVSATVVGSSVFTTNAVHGTHAVAMNGTFYGTFSDNPLTGTGAFTVSVWLYNSDYVGFAGAIASSGSGQFRLRQRSIGENVLEARVGTSAGTFVLQEPLPLNRWQHWVLTWDSTATGDGFPKLYVDGQ